MACKIRMGEKEYTQEEFDSIPLVEKLEAILSSPDLERYVELGVTGLHGGAVFTTEAAVDPEIQTEYETALVDAADELTNTLNHAKEIQKKIRDVFGKHMNEEQVEMGLIMLDVMANAWAMKNNTIKEAYYLRYADVQDSGTANELLTRIAQSKQELEETVIEEEVVEPVTEEVVVGENETVDHKVNDSIDLISTPVQTILDELETKKTFNEKLDWLRDNGLLQPIVINGVAYNTVDYSDRVMVLMKIGNVNIPFYISTGQAGKKDVKIGNWYAVFGIGEERGWINKGSASDINSQYGQPIFQKLAKILNEGVGDIQSREDGGNGRLKDGIGFLDSSKEAFREFNKQMNLPITPAGNNNMSDVFYDNVKKAVEEVNRQLLSISQSNSSVTTDTNVGTPSEQQGVTEGDTNQESPSNEVIREESSETETVIETSPETETEVESEVVNESVVEGEDLLEENISAVLKETYDLLDRLFPESLEDVTLQDLQQVVESDESNTLEDVVSDEPDVVDEIIGELFILPEDTPNEVYEQVRKISDIVDSVVRGVTKIKDVGNKFGKRFTSFVKNLALNVIDKVYSKSDTSTHTATTGEQNSSSEEVSNTEIKKSKGVARVREVADKFKRERNIKRPSHPFVKKLESWMSKEIANAYANAKAVDNSPESISAYDALEKESLVQYQYIVDSGMKIERWLGEGEPYSSSREMLEDLEKGHMYFLPNDSAFGDGTIDTEGRLGLKKVGVKLDDGYEMTFSEVFRVVHDYFGHGLLGNEFGAIGEENATLQHLELFTVKAAPALIFQTRGQNSWVNYSDANGEANAKFKEARRLDKEGEYEEAAKVRQEGQQLFKFAEPKDSIFEDIYNFKFYGTVQRIREERETKNHPNYIDSRGTNENNDVSSLHPTITSRRAGKYGEKITRRSVQEVRQIDGYDVEVVAEYTFDSKLDTLIKNVFPNYKGSKKVYEIKDGAVYSKLLQKHSEGNIFNASVTLHSDEEFSKMRLFVTEDGATGVTLTNEGFLGGAYSSMIVKSPNSLAQMMFLGIKEGAITAEAFDTILPDYYSMFGFKAVSRTAFNDEFKPMKANGALADWDYETYKDFNGGRPDVVFMIYDGGPRETIEERTGMFDMYKTYQKSFTQSFDEWGYDAATNVMNIEAYNRSLTDGYGDVTQSPTIEDEVSSVINNDGEVLFETRAQVSNETLAEYETIRSEAKANGTFMKAPNGQPTNLTEDQWIQVRSKAFKDWFGDWDGVSEYSGLSNKELVDLRDRYRELRDESRSSSDYDRYDQEYLKVLSVIEGGVNTDHSLILDENGEPRVMYHGTNVEFDAFRLDATKVNRNGNTDGIYFTSNRELAESVYGSNIKEVFLNIRNFALRSEYRPSTGAVNMLKDYIISEVSNDESYYNGKLNAFRNRGESDVASTSLKREMYLHDGYDGLVDGSITNGEVVVFNPNQIKSAVGNVGSFSKDTSNIYYQQGESVVQRAAVQGVGGNKFILHALQAPDVGSLVHEFMHVAEQDLDDADLETLENWSGHKRGTVEFKEAVADGMVKFVSEDHPEISAINEVFSKIAKLLKSLYRGLVASPLDLKMDDNVRMVYAKILGAEEAFSRRVNAAENQASEMSQSERASFIKDRHNDPKLKKYVPSQLKSGTKVVRKDGSIGIVGVDDLSGTTAKDRKDGVFELLSYPTLKDVGLLLQSKNKPQSSLKNKKKVVPSCT